MTDLEREAREAAEVYRVACGLGTVGSGQLTHEAIGYAQGFYDAAAPREQELRRLRLLAEEQLTTLRKLKAEMLSDTRDQEIERLRARVAELEGMVPKWVQENESAILNEQGWSISETDKIGNGPRMWLMVPPIPLPETK